MRKILHILFMFCCFVLKAQTQLFTIEDGLSSKDITCILQTKSGLLWIGTADGLNVYDGYTFREYNRENGLSNGKIKCLYEDKKGSLWIGTWKGLNILNLKTGEIRQYFNKEKNEKESVVSSEITAITGHTDGSILVGIGDGELLSFKDERGYTKVYQLPVREKVFKYQFYDLKPTADSCLFFLTNYATVQKLDKNFHEIKKFSIGSDVIIQMELVEKGRKLLLVDVFNKIYYASITTGNTYAGKPAISIPKAPDYVIAVYLSDKRRLWKGFGDGSLTMTDLVTKQTIDYSSVMNRFITGAPSFIYEDSKGILWVGTHYGLVKFYPKKNLFENYLMVQGGEYKDKNSIRGMIQNDSGDVYIGGYNGLFRIAAKDNSVKHLSFPNHAFGKTNAYYPYRLLEDKNYIWLSSEIKGLLRFNKKTYDLEFPITTSAFFKSYALLKKDSNSFWIGTHNGLFLYDTPKNTLTKYKSPENGINISNIEVTDLAKDAAGNTWIGSYSSGLFKMDPAHKISRHYSEATTNLPINFVSCLFSENDSILWAGTRGGGLFKINEKSRSVKCYTKKNGLADNSVAGILKDNNGNLWISTFNGLSKFDPQSEKFENYYDKDGLSDNEFNISAHLKAKDGKLYFGGLNGINAFYPDSLKKEAQQKPGIFLTRFIKYDGVNDSLRERYGDLDDLKDITLSYKDKFFSFYFSLDDYYDPLRNTFYYKLDGYDKDWTNLGTQNNIRFNTLPAGSYTLRIKGVSGEGIASRNELGIRLSISQPFYSTWWFYLLLLAFTAVIAYTIARYKIYQVLKIRKLRTKISSDLHDEVGSLLTRITIQAELMKQGILENDPVQQVTKIADTSRLATSAMSDVLWSIDARNDKIRNLLDRLREQAGETLFPLEIEVEFKVHNLDPEKELDTLVRQNLFLIFKEAIHNIAKHSSATKVTILLENRMNQFVMSIKDNGSGQRSAFTKQGQGLRNMSMRAELMEGILQLSHENGYEVLLKIKKL